MTENKFIIKNAEPEDSKKIGEIFDLYRQFYKKESNVEACKSYIKERLSNNESLELSKKIILYDLYVRSEYRRKGVGHLLMNAAKDYAKKNNITSIELSTAITNTTAQSLYESLGYKRDEEYFDYYFVIE